MREYQAIILFDRRLSDLERAGLRVTGRMKPADSIVVGDLIAFEGRGGVLILSATHHSIDQQELADALGCRTVQASSLGRVKAYAVLEAGVPQPRGRVWLNGEVNEQGRPLPEEMLLTSSAEADRHRELVERLSGIDASVWLKGRGTLVERPRTRRRWWGRAAS